MSLKSFTYIIVANPHCRMFEEHDDVWARAFALESAGNSIAARIAIMAITTNNSISVNPPA